MGSRGDFEPCNDQWKKESAVFVDFRFKSRGQR